MTTDLSGPHTDALFEAWREVGSTDEQLREAVCTSRAHALQTADESKGVVLGEYEQLMRDREGLCLASIDRQMGEGDDAIDSSRLELEVFELAQMLSESHLGLKMSVRNGEGSKLVDIRFTNIVREDPEQCFSALLRIDGGFTLQETKPALDVDEDLHANLLQACKNSTSLKDLVRYLRKCFVQKYGSA